jgi:hypothetical protein
MIKYIAMATIVATLASCQPTAGNGESAQANTMQVCTYIHHAISSASLDDRSTQVAIKLAGARDGVTERIRNAIDAYYRGDKLGGQQAMLTACAAAGYRA